MVILVVEWTFMVHILDEPVLAHFKNNIFSMAGVSEDVNGNQVFIFMVMPGQCNLLQFNPQGP